MNSLLTGVSMTGTAIFLAKATLILSVAWTVQLCLRRGNPRWRIFFWRASLVALAFVAVVSLYGPTFTLPLLPASYSESSPYRQARATNRAVALSAADAPLGRPSWRDRAGRAPSQSTPAHDQQVANRVNWPTDRSETSELPECVLPMARGSHVMSRIHMIQRGVGRSRLPRWKTCLVAVGSDQHEMIIPVRLKTDCIHRIGVNLNRVGFRGLFVSDEGNRVGANEWQFRTRARQLPPDAPRPRVVSIHPAPDSQVARVTLLRIRFDHAMDPLMFGAFPPGESDATEPEIQVNSGVLYDDTHYEFTIPVTFKANWAGEVRLDGFRSQQGVAAEPWTATYTTTETVFAEGHRQMDQEALVALRRVIEKTRQARRQLRSVSETVRSVSLTNRNRLASGFVRLEGQWSRFKMQGERQFFADVGPLMRYQPFQIGSDGSQCWFYCHNFGHDEQTPTLTGCDFDDIPQKELNFLEPFGPDELDVDELIEHRRLEYAGRGLLDGRECEVVRAWRSHFGNKDRIWLWIQQWWIDSETSLPLQVTSDGVGNRDVNRIEYDSINEQLAKAEF